VKLNIVPARTGVQWVKLGVQTFLKQPLALAGLFFMYMAAVLVLSQLPVLGPLLAGMLVPAATLGLMAATAEASRGRFPMPSVLISAFRAGKQQARAMLILGALYTAGSLLASVIGGLLIDAGPPAPPPAAGAEATPQIDARTLFVLALHAPLMLLFWHAPALVHWHQVPPVKALFFSAVACLRNFGALLIYGVTWLGVFLGVGFVLSSLGLMLGGLAVARSVMMPTVLLLVAMFTTSMYFTFRDSFRDNDDNEGAPAAPEGETT
jgi:MFS family permease